MWNNEREEFSKIVKDIMYERLGPDLIGHLNLRPRERSPSPPSSDEEEMSSSPVTVQPPRISIQEMLRQVPPRFRAKPEDQAPSRPRRGQEFAPLTGKRRPSAAKKRPPTAVEAPAVSREARWLNSYLEKAKKRSLTPFPERSQFALESEFPQAGEASFGQELAPPTAKGGPPTAVEPSVAPGTPEEVTSIPEAAPKPTDNVKTKKLKEDPVYAPPTTGEVPSDRELAPSTSKEGPPTAKEGPPTSTEVPSGQEVAPPTAKGGSPEAKEAPPTEKESPPTAVEPPVAPSVPEEVPSTSYAQPKPKDEVKFKKPKRRERLQVVVSGHDPEQETVGLYRIIKIMSPTEIYMMPAHKFKYETNKYYKKKKTNDTTCEINGVFYHPGKAHPQMHMMYKYYDKELKAFHRVRVMDRFPDRDEVLIYYLELFMKAEIVPSKDLVECTIPELNNPSLKVIRCHLHDIAPLDNGQTWSPEACQHLKLLLKHKRYWNVLKMSSFKKLVYRGTMDSIHDMGVVIFGQDKTYPIESINYRLVDAGFAKAIGIGANPPKLPYFGGQMPYFNEDEGSFNPDLAPTYRDTIPHFVSFCMGQIKIDYVKSPDVIYVQELKKVEELRVMEDAIGDYIEQKDISSIGSSKIKNLQAVAAHVWDNKNEVFHYHRAVVMDIAWNHVEILLVDYGNIMQINFKHLWKLPEKYAIIPAYCHRVHLNTVKPSSSKDHVLSTWSKSFTQALIKKIKQLDERGKPAYFPLRSDPANTTDETIHLTEINQRLNFDRNQNKWVAKEMEMDDEEKGTLEKMKNNPLLKTHLASYGLDIILVPNGFSHVDGVLWGQTYLVDHFMGPEINGMEILKERYDKKDFYGKLLHGFDKFWEDMLQ